MEKRGKRLGNLNEYQRDRANIIIERINEGCTVLDLGCGDGAVLMEMQRLKTFDAIGADISKYALGNLEMSGISTIHVDFRDHDAFEGLPEADHVLLLEVLEHFPDPESLLDKMSRKARRSMFFSIPNTGYLSHRARLLLGRFPLQWRVHPGEHLRFWTYGDLQWWLRELGYAEQANIYPYQGVKVLNALWPSLFAEGFVVEIKNRQPAVCSGSTAGRVI